jgi:RNA polymerase sigma factor (sigma-70 family)
MPGQPLQQNAEENALVERARQKDPVAIRLLIKQQHQRLYRIARSIVRNDSDAEDVLQEAYIRAFAGLDGFRGEARIGTWFARIVINEALGWRRRRRPTQISCVSTETNLNTAWLVTRTFAQCARYSGSRPSRREPRLGLPRLSPRVCPLKPDLSTDRPGRLRVAGGPWPRSANLAEGPLGSARTLI